MTKTLVNISYYAGHAKGGDNIGHLPGALHAEWLEQAVDFYRKELDEYAGHFPEWAVMVAMTGFGGMLNVEAGRERDAYWRIFPRAWIIGVSNNPGHQVGAALTIRLGLETAGKLGFDFLIHTAEDVIPRRGALQQMEQLLRDGWDYVGEAWGNYGDELNAQFFGVRTQALVASWDACAVTGYGCIEKYLAAMLQGRRVNTGLTGRLYSHTHDFEDWKRCIHGAR